MLQIKNISKSYTTGDLTQVALDDVSVSFRKSEFVAVLGQSGSGKTTLLNIMGGLDHYDNGDLLIDGISTKRYKDRDWDTYRNHRIGFIFQSYNLIPHQSVLANVELALTLADVKKAERKRRAIEALKAVGLVQHIHKKPNQLSGGQMQRVAIARALVNNPDIVLADEPTGALDTETGIQVMDILKKVASDRLVVMVTHNADLAKHYATRIVRLADGRIIDDSMPFNPQHQLAEKDTEQNALANEKDGAAPLPDGTDPLPEDAAPLPDGTDPLPEDTSPTVRPVVPQTNKKSKTKRKASMSFLTALGLSFSNLMTKKGRTFLTAFAGSIGIIGIAAILALSNGTNNYIADTEEEALASYPLTITKSSFDLSSLFAASTGYMTTDEGSFTTDTNDSSLIPTVTIMGDMFAQVKNNDLKTFKEFLDNDESGIAPYVNAIEYDYGIVPQVFMADTTDDVVQVNPSSMSALFTNGLNASSLATEAMFTDLFQEMLDARDLVTSQMDVVSGRWPERYDEAVLVLSQGGKISDYTLYSLGVFDHSIMDDMVEQLLLGNEVTVPEISQDFTYEDALALHFKIVPLCTMYSYNADQNTWTDHSKDKDYLAEQIEQGIDLKIVGVVQPAATSSATLLSEGIAYTPELTRYLMDIAADSRIVNQQKDNPAIDVFTGKTFEELQQGEGSQLDFESMFSVDEEALKNAFSFDTSALDMSSFDMSGLDMDSFTPSNLDTDSLDLDSSALSSTLDTNSMAQIMQGAPEPDFSSFEPTASAEEQAAINLLRYQLISGFMSYLISQGPTVEQMQDTLYIQARWQEYITGEGAPLVAQLNVLTRAPYARAVTDILNNYIEDQFAPYFAQQMQSLMTEAATAMTTQMAQAMQAQMALAAGQMGTQISDTISRQLQTTMAELSENLQDAFSVDADAFTSAIQFNMTQEDLTSLLTNYMNAEDLTYETNLVKLGYADIESPNSVGIYPIDFASKEAVLDIIDRYNNRMTAEGNDESVIQYSDVAGALMKSVTNIVDAISLVLIAFVSISLIVSSIMIAIITYISVLERRKEIGILRALGASKTNISNVFNAETIIEGFAAGVFAIALVYLASVPVNAFVLAGWNVPNVMSLPLSNAFVLVAISVFLTFIAGLIPSRMAAHRNPVEALRSE